LHRGAHPDRPDGEPVEHDVVGLQVEPERLCPAPRTIDSLEVLLVRASTPYFAPRIRSFLATVT